MLKNSFRRCLSSMATSFGGNPLVNGVNRHVVAALVANQPETVAEITNLICARGYNVDSFVVGRTNVPHLVRLSVVVHGTDHHANMMKQQLNDVVQVAAVKILTTSQHASSTLVERDLLLAKISVSSQEARSELDSLVNEFDAKIVKYTSNDHVMIQMTGKPSKLDQFLQILHPFGIVEVHRSGVIAMDLDNTMADHTMNIDFTRHYPNEMTQVDSTLLPPG